MANEEEAKSATAEQPPAPVEEKEKKKTKGTKEKKPRKPKTASHPPYFQMIKEALVALNEKSGSSPYAIAKYMEEKHKAVLPPNFRKILALQLKNSVAKGNLIKIRASYKLSVAGKREKTTSTTKTNDNKKKTTTKTRPTMIRATRSTTSRPKRSVNAITEATMKMKKKAGARKTKPKHPKSIKSQKKA